MIYSGLTLNQYGVASPCRTSVLSAALLPCPDLNLIHYICVSAASSPCPDLNLIHYTIQKGRLKTSDDLLFDYAVSCPSISNADPG